MRHRQQSWRPLKFLILKFHHGRTVKKKSRIFSRVTQRRYGFTGTVVVVIIRADNKSRRYRDIFFANSSPVFNIYLAAK